jgi:predicted AlkP superfamily phosphohydrolase/phosphomutase
MPPGSRCRVLAIGLDAAEPSLVRALAERGDVPTLQGLLARGASGPVASPAHVGSGAVWPTFVAGAGPSAHGIHSFWSWDAGRMGLYPASLDHLTPFWRRAAAAGRAVGVLDVPFAPRPAATRGFEIAEWGPHDSILGRMHAVPASLAARVRAIGGEHPMTGALDATTTGRGADGVLEGCLAGARQRARLAEHLLREEAPELFLAVFPEIHRASHVLWHTATPGQPGLVDLYREVDRHLGRLVAAAGEGAAVLVFSLHGIRATRGVPDLLDPLLRARGLAAPRRETPLSALKRRMPTGVKRLYHRLVPRAMTVQVARSGLTPRYDWSRTRAFPLPTDQHGWIRVNLAGREAEGIVPPAQYGATCEEIAGLLAALRTDDGEPVVQRVIRVAGDDPAAAPARLPDLVVHWAARANAGPFRLRTPPLACELVFPRVTGQHAPEGFWVLRSPRTPGPEAGQSLAAEVLGQLLLDQVAAP